MLPRIHLRPRLLTLRIPNLHHQHVSTSSQNPSNLLAGRHALITGGSSGIGLSIAHALASHGCRITLVSRTASRLSSALETIPATNPGGKHTYIVGDVGDSSFWTTSRNGIGTALLQTDREVTGEENVKGSVRVDILVNSAGISQTGLFVRSTLEELDRIIQVNLKGAMQGIRYMVKGKHLRVDKKDEGSGWSPVVVNVGSLLGLQGGRGAAAYASSKAGLIGLTRALAAELGPTGIRVNALVPGYIDTNMTAGFDASMRSALLQRIPLQRFGTADEVAQAAVFLATNQYANNCVINLDGGLSAI